MSDDMSRRITFSQDRQRAYAQYLDDGCFIEPSVISPEVCDRLIAASKSLPSACDGSYVPMMQVHRLDPAYFEVMSDAKIVSIVDYILHGEAVGLQTQYFFTPPKRAGLGHHQDNYFVEAPIDAFVSVWVPLVDVTVENGGLYYFKGSHKRGKLPVRKVEGEGKDKRQTVYEETIMPEDYPKVDVHVKRGDAVLIHGYVVHGSYQNESAANRHVLLNTYIRAGAPFRAGATAKREEVPLKRVS
jgi:ectoine hydroxylase-related dioxygenase (phytanoyl-CoA dioxygenase family)